MSVGEWSRSGGLMRQFALASLLLASTALLVCSGSRDTTRGASRILVQVVGPDESPVGMVHVTVSSGGSTLVDATTGSDGRLVVVPSRDHVALPMQGTVTVAPVHGGPQFAPVTAPPAGNT